jgi:hypothetical protein
MSEKLATNYNQSFQSLFRVKKGDEIPYILLERWANHIGDMTTASYLR